MRTGGMITPGRQQYLRLKARHPDALLLYRMGDFYELFDEDAVVGARLLGITLTSRAFGRGGRVPMAGIPHHALNGYVRRLLRAGQRIAVCEQLSEPGKGLVERDVVRVLSPGTVDDPALLDAQRANYLLALARHGAMAGLCWVDVSTGACEYRLLAVDDAGAVSAFIQQLAPAETVAFARDDLPDLAPLAVRPLDNTLTLDEAERLLRRQFPALDAQRPALSLAIAALIQYLEHGHGALLRALEQPVPFQADGVMILDSQTRLNLEIDLRQRDRPDLFGLLNRARTAPGARRLRLWLDRPLTDRYELERRLDAVAELSADAPTRARAIKLLSASLDLERLATRLATGAIRAGELLALADTLGQAEALRRLLIGKARSALLREAAAELDDVPEARALIADAVGNEHARSIRVERDPRVAAVRASLDADRAALAALEQTERARTGIRSLKIGHNKVTGYYFEVSRANRQPLPPHFERKQTLTNAERYVTPDLMAAERRLAVAGERLAALEAELFTEVLAQLAPQVGRMRATASAIATIDVLAALATVAVERRFTRPVLTDANELAVAGGRHPVVECGLTPGAFVPNDVTLDDEHGAVVVLTGPNMAGKSTYLRQAALIALLAHVGSFVPADAARIGVVDRIFTRIGAHDDLASGRSTFMVEMLETATILRNASERSLVVLDEIGRGTGTQDGVAIATAVVEDLALRIGARTLFATHYRELAHVAERLPGVRAMQTAVARHAGEHVFLHSIVPGIADSAFGIEIARLAGVPDAVIQRARDVIPTAEMPRSVGAHDTAGPAVCPSAGVIASERVIADLRALDIGSTTPLEALNQLAEFQRRLRAAVSEPLGPRALAAEAPRAYGRAD